jgi:hypothetical protein
VDFGRIEDSFHLMMMVTTRHRALVDSEPERLELPPGKRELI